MQVIILEGENKTGKTTLANFLKDKYGFKYVKCSQPKRDPYVEYIEIIKKIARSTSDAVSYTHLRRLSEFTSKVAKRYLID